MSEFSYILDKKETFDSIYCEEEIVDLLSQTFRIPDDFRFNIMQTTEEHICRPDLVSYDAYGTPEHAELLMKLNGISNPFELNSDVYIIIPTYDYLEDFTIIPAKSTHANIAVEEFIPAVASPIKNTRRTTNDSLVGDNRYKINPATGVITY